jgi:hypothetical protein
MNLRRHGAVEVTSDFHSEDESSILSGATRYELCDYRKYIMVHEEKNRYERRDMDHLENPMLDARRQGELVLSVDDDGDWFVMLFGVVCSDGTTEFESYVRVSRAEVNNIKRV